MARDGSFVTVRHKRRMLAQRERERQVVGSIPTGGAAELGAALAVDACRAPDRAPDRPAARLEVAALTPPRRLLRRHGSAQTQTRVELSCTPAGEYRGR